MDVNCEKVSPCSIPLTKTNNLIYTRLHFMLKASLKESLGVFCMQYCTWLSIIDTVIWQFASDLLSILVSFTF